MMAMTTNNSTNVKPLELVGFDDLDLLEESKGVMAQYAGRCFRPVTIDDLTSPGSVCQKPTGWKTPCLASVLRLGDSVAHPLHGVQREFG